MAKDTKERILDAALRIFARDGYAGTNIRDIAEEVGIVKSALYRHFASKEEIWTAVCRSMTVYYNERFGSPDRLPPVPGSTEELAALTLRMVDFTMHDEKVIAMRKLLLTEQFRDERVKKLATEFFMDDKEIMFTKLFEGMMANGSLKKADPGVLAFMYTAPVSALIHLVDREPEKEAEATEKLRRFIGEFIAVYGGDKK